MRGFALASVVVVALSTPTMASPDAKPPPPATNVWKPVFFASLGVDLAVIGYGMYSYVKMNDEAEQIEARRPGGGFEPLSSEDCGTSVMVENDVGGHYDSACTWQRRSKIAAFISLPLTAFVVVAGYLAFRSRPSNDLALVPTVTREMAGAELSLRF